jgi:hypothetical protein
MKVLLSTETSFLDKNLGYLEQVLLGEFHQYQDPTRPYYYAQFTLEPQPVLTIGRNITDLNDIEAHGVKNGFFIDADTFPQTLTKTFQNWSLARFKNVANYFLGTLMLSASALLIIFYGPSLYYAVFPSKVAQPPTELAAIVADNFKVTAEEEILEKIREFQQAEIIESDSKIERYLPPVNTNLPEGDWVSIPLIGVYSQLQKTESAEEALETGIWWVPDFGEPGQLNKPMIVSGHRYGWQWWWQSDYWKYHSFYKLPELQPGDRVEIISEQRKWIYEIYAGEEGAEINDYQADLILYTCKFLNSPVRIFRYAKLISG